jgi:hypothetical protein
MKARFLNLFRRFVRFSSAALVVSDYFIPEEIIMYRFM